MLTPKLGVGIEDSNSWAVVGRVWNCLDVTLGHAFPPDGLAGYAGWCNAVCKISCPRPVGTESYAGLPSVLLRATCRTRQQQLHGLRGRSRKPGSRSVS